MGPTDYSGEQSVFNMGIALLIRIDKILTEIAIAKMRGDQKTWYAGLFALKGEVFYLMTDPEKKELNKMLEEIYPLISLSNKKARTGYIFQDPKLAWMLENIENSIKSSLHKRGMMGAKRNDPRYALANS